MQASIFKLLNNKWAAHSLNPEMKPEDAELILCFAAKEAIKTEDVYIKLKQKFLNAEIAICSTSGEIYNDTVLGESVVVVALRFKSTRIKTATINIRDFENSYTAAVGLVTALPQQNLKYILILSDGALVNGSELIKGLKDAAGKDILITGGLAGDGSDFKSTLVGLNKKPAEGEILAIGFYGDSLMVKHGSMGGWDMFGLEKEITKSKSNVLYEIDGGNALELYKKYLGPDAENLPSSALLFPLAVTMPGASRFVVRTILSINEEDKSMTFAGDVPEGAKVRLMSANFDKLTEAASQAAQQTIFENNRPDFCLLISCVGRKLIFGPRTEDEVEAVKDTLGEATVLAGFYSYGEISPFNLELDCQLHNQTMTITSFYELP